MTIRNLDKLFSPKSAVLVGASERPGSVGAKMTENFLKGGFDGKIWCVNPKHSAVQGQRCYPDIESLPEAADFAIIAIPPRAVPETIAKLGAKGTRAAVVVSAGIRENNLQQAMLDAAKPHCFRIVGPNSLGMMIPGIGLNAGFAHAMPQAGDLAFISQSGALISAVLDWSLGRGIGFSCMASVGDMADVDVGDLLDYLAGDTQTRAILMYLEQVTNPRKFMSAARSAARVKPVIVVKSGRHAGAAKAARSHTGAMAGSDIVYDAAFRRAGLVRVNNLEDLFDAAEILSHVRRLNGNRLAIVTNGGGAGILAVDELESGSGTLATLSEETIKTLDALLPPIWSKGNPIDIIGDAGSDRYAAAVKAALADSGTDAVLVMNCPTALASGEMAATVTTKAAQDAEKPVLTCWLGDSAADKPRAIFARAGLPSFNTPADAVRGFSYLVAHRQTQESLLQTPPGLPEGYSTDEKTARKIIAAALAAGRSLLSEVEAKAVLSAYGIPVVPTIIAKTPEDARTAATSLLKGEVREIALKILSDDITHKSDAGGVVLGLPDAATAESAAREMLNRLKTTHPDARIEGFTVQPMIRRPHARELIGGMSVDATFGPVILFGAGGTAVEVIADRAVSLPPLDLKLAYDLIEQTRVRRLLRAYRNIPAADTDAVALTLVRLSQLVTDIPEIQEVDINPFLADENGVIALDARIVVKQAAAAGSLRLAIRPYPKQWERQEKLKTGRAIILRPIRPEDEGLYGCFMEKITPEDIYNRLFAGMKHLHLSHDFIARLTQIDYDRAMAFVALDAESGEMLGVSRLAADPDYARAEYAIIVRSDVQKQGIGTALLRQLVDYAKAEGIGELWGDVLLDNAAMLKMCGEFGFNVKRSAHDMSIAVASLPLAA